VGGDEAWWRLAMPPVGVSGALYTTGGPPRSKRELVGDGEPLLPIGVTDDSGGEVEGIGGCICRSASWGSRCQSRGVKCNKKEIQKADTEL